MRSKAQRGVGSRARRAVRQVPVLTLFAAAIALVGGMVAPPALAAQGKRGKRGSAIQVGFILPLSGVLSNNGNYEANGFKLGLQRYGEEIDGHRIVVHYVDAHATPTAALADAKLLVTSDHVDMVEGPIMSAAAGAVDTYVLSHGVPDDDVSLAAADFIPNYNKYGIGQSSGWTDYQPSTIAATYSYTTLKWKRVATIALNQQFGWQSVGGFSSEFQKLGGSIDKVIWVPESAVDLSTFISEIPSTSQGVFAVLSGSGAANFLNEYSAFGLSAKIPVIAMLATDQAALSGVHGSAAVGTWATAQYCTDLPTSLNRKFVNSYRSEYGLLPSFYSDLGFVKAEILDKALAQLHGVVKQPKELGAAMRKVKIVAPRGPVSISKTTHSAVEDQYICQVKTVGGVMRNVPVKTYKNLPPWGLLTKSTWQTAFAQQSLGPPSS